MPTPYPREATIHGLFAEQARLTPEAVAVVFGDETLTYAELHARAGCLAARLAALGVGPDVPVGLCAERSLDLIVAILGILEAGGAYVPLDPNYPADRLAFMLEDVAAPVLVVQERLLGLLPPSDARVVLLESLGSGAEEAVPAPPADPENLAYVLYTSGSTGQPKGVAVTHRNVVRLVKETDYARFGPDEVFLQLAPVSFDASTLEIWGPLLNGGRLVVFPPGPPSLPELGRALERHGVTTLWLTAGLFHQMVEENLPGLRPVRQLLAGGDVLSPDPVRRVLEELPGTVLVNGYGPTENTTFTCCHSMTDPAEVGATVPIGRPIANTSVYLIDGELYAGGDGLARGYFNRPDLTAERFVPDPVSGRAGERLYRTGDLARFQPDGTIEFLGRADNQVKVRGFRIEPGEIESVLRALPGVLAAVVIAREDRPGEKRLVACVVRAGEEPSAASLRQALEERLPSYMVPGLFAFPNEIPLTPNGKVDRQALARVPMVSVESETGVAPRTPAEELVAGIFAELLGLPRVGLRDDFFLLGGHSLLATRALVRVSRATGVELPAASLFENPTVEGLAARVEEALGGLRAETEPLARVPRDGALRASFTQEHLWFLDRFAPGQAVYNLPMAVHLAGPLEVPTLAAALSGVVARHEALRTVLAEVDGVPVQEIRPAEPVALPVVDLSAVPSEEAARLTAEEAVRPFDLAAGPLLRAALLVLGPTEHRLLLNQHHVVSDAWSLELLLRELTALYGGAELPELPVQYADFAAWQRRRLSGEALENLVHFWRERLAGAPEAIDLPTDRPRPAVRSFRGRVIETRPAAPLPLEETARRHGATPFMVLLAAYAAFLKRVTGQDDVVVGTPAAGRTGPEVQELIGFFANILPLRVHPVGDPRVTALLDRVRGTVLSAYARQELPFEKIVEAVAPGRDLSKNPIFQVALGYPGEAAIPKELAPGLALAMEEVPTGTSKFDLTFHFDRVDGALRIRAESAADLFDRATAERLLGGFATLLAGAVADPEARLSELPLLSAAERAQLLAWGENPLDVPRGVCFHELFERWVDRAPDDVAV
ncbi:MAG TPA: amino acid adenylation domain-containing protein, partial [Thermoanaerobaculia bacterium]|nr:amino acid adenylation domain-containing protein [Thermoanaerobaculia bacterium]